MNTVQIEQSVRRLYEAQQEKKKFDKYYNEVRKKEQLAVINFMFTNLPKGEETFDIELKDGVNYYTNHVKLKVTKVRRKKLTWKFEKLKQNISKKLYKTVVNKTYKVNDMDGLIKYLKQCGVDAKKFKKFIDVEESMNEIELDKMYETGKISKEDKAQLGKCCDVEISEPYIKITEQKGQNNMYDKNIWRKGTCESINLLWNC